MEPYQPEPLPPQGLDLPRLIRLVGTANAALARYDGLLQSLVNPKILLSPLTNQEAVLSSRIEGTQATVEEVLEHEAGQDYADRKNEDILEILNYRKALILGSEEVAERPIRLGMIREMHRLLMTSVRGEDKTPGEFRKDQNWIGRPGCTMEEASFVPPSPLQLEDHLRAWEAYLDSSDFDFLAQSGVMHAQFELLHPFRDGNGRIGRLLIPLYLCRTGLLSSPMFYLSAYLEKNRSEYYSRLAAISQKQDWTGWLEFYLQAVTEQANINTRRVEEIRQLYDNIQKQVRKTTRSQYTQPLVDHLFDRPIFRVTDLERIGIPKPTAHTLIRQLLESGMVKVFREASGRRPAIIGFPELLQIAEGRELASRH